MAALRASGKSTLSSAYAVVLETDGSFSVLEPPDSGACEALRHVRRPSGVPGPSSETPGLRRGSS